MSPITYEEAYQHTDPSASDEERKASAQAIQNSVLANEIYWQQHNDPLTALKAAAAGHGQVVSEHTDEVTGGLAPGVVDSTAVEEGTTPEELGTGATGATGATGGTTTSTVAAAPVNPQAAVQELRAQLRDAGLEPKA